MSQTCPEKLLEHAKYGDMRTFDNFLEEQLQNEGILSGLVGRGGSEEDQYINAVMMGERGPEVRKLFIQRVKELMWGNAKGKVGRLQRQMNKKQAQQAIAQMFLQNR